MSDSIDWSLTTFEGNRLRQHREFMALPFREKMIRMEQASEVAELFRKGRDSRAPRDSSASTSRS